MLHFACFVARRFQKSERFVTSSSTSEMNPACVQRNVRQVLTRQTFRYTPKSLRCLPRPTPHPPKIIDFSNDFGPFLGLRMGGTLVGTSRIQKLIFSRFSSSGFSFLIKFLKIHETINFMKNDAPGAPRVPNFSNFPCWRKCAVSRGVAPGGHGSDS